MQLSSHAECSEMENRYPVIHWNMHYLSSGFIQKFKRLTVNSQLIQTPSIQGMKTEPILIFLIKVFRFQVAIAAKESLSPRDHKNDKCLSI